MTNHLLPLSSRNGVILSAIEIRVPVLFEPLQEFEVILEPALDEAFDGDGPVDAVSRETRLQDFKVVEVLVLRVYREPDLAHRHVQVDCVKQLAVDRAGSALFDFRDFELQGLVDPVYELLA